MEVRMGEDRDNPGVGSHADAVLLWLKQVLYTGREGHLADYYTSPQSLNLFRWLNRFEEFYLIFIGWFIMLSV